MLKDYFAEGCRGEGLDLACVDYYHNWRREKKTTDFIIVDEAQDFSESAIREFQQHARRTLLLYGDSSQQIYSFRKGPDAPLTMEAIQHLTKLPSEQLVFNHRLPASIARVAEYINVDHDDLAGRCKEKGTELPHIMKCSSLTMQLDTIASLIQAREYDDVGILVPKNENVKTTVSYLQKKGMLLEKKYNENSRSFSDLNFATSNPKVLTYHSAKGLQFEAVFLPDCEAAKVGRFLEPLYVAMTRTYQSLYLLYTDDLPKPLRKIPKDIFDDGGQSNEMELL